MAILDKIKSVGAAIKDKVEETFGDGRHDEHEGDSDLGVELAPALDGPAARRALGLKSDASLADVREAYRRLAREHFGRARSEGPDSAAARLLDRALDALELLEDELLPLGGAAAANLQGAPTSSRKRATPRGP